MGNKGQTTVLCSLMLSVLFLFTLTALEVGRIYMSKVKIRAVVHSTQSGIMADYNSELFERYHLLFMDPTYGTGSEAAAEEKIEDYLDASLNSEKGKIYQFTIEEIGLTDQKYILEKDMEQIKEQIAEHEKTAGLLQRIRQLKQYLNKEKNGVGKAAEETGRNGIPFSNGKDQVTEDKTKEMNKETENEKEGGKEDSVEIEVTDPRDTLAKNLRQGLLAFVLPEDCPVSGKEHDFGSPPSKKYKEQKEEERDDSFRNIDFLNSFLSKEKEDTCDNLEKQAAFVCYVNSYFSNMINPREKTVVKCEAEYILKGKNNDYDNLEGVVKEMIWLRMPVNYAYLLTDEQKKSEALTAAAAICTATGTTPMMEVEKYLLLGCWAYGETLCEMKQVLSGKKIPYIKTKDNWYTDLKGFKVSDPGTPVEQGWAYEDLLMVLLAKKGGKNIYYARMLDLMEVNLQQENPDFKLADCVGGLTIQGKIQVNPLFIYGSDKGLYEHYFEEAFSY